MAAACPTAARVRKPAGRSLVVCGGRRAVYAPTFFAFAVKTERQLNTQQKSTSCRGLRNAAGAHGAAINDDG